VPSISLTAKRDGAASKPPPARFWEGKNMWIYFVDQSDIKRYINVENLASFSVMDDKAVVKLLSGESYYIDKELVKPFLDMLRMLNVQIRGVEVKQ